MEPSLVLSPQQRSSAAVQLLDLYEDIAALVQFANGQKRPPQLRPVPSWVSHLKPMIVGESHRDVLRRWASLYAGEILVVQEARNSVAHSLPISDADLAAALRIAARLLLIAQSGDALPNNSGEVIEPRIESALRFGRDQ